MIVGIESSKYSIDFKFYESAKQKFNNINSAKLHILLEYPKIFKASYSEDNPISNYYIKIKSVFSSKIDVINIELFKTKEYGKITKGTINIIDVYKIEYSLPEKLLDILSVFNDLREILEKAKNLFLGNEIDFDIQLFKNFNCSPIKNEAELTFIIDNQPNNITKIREFTTKFINLANKDLHIKIREKDNYIRLEKNSSNISFLSLDKIERIFQIFNILNNIEELEITNSSQLKIKFKNSMSIEMNIDKFLENFNNYINSMKLLTSNFIQIVLDFVEKRVDISKREQILKTLSGVIEKFGEELDKIDNFIKLLSL